MCQHITTRVQQQDAPTPVQRHTKQQQQCTQAARQNCAHTCSVAQAIVYRKMAALTAARKQLCLAKQELRAPAASPPQHSSDAPADRTQQKRPVQEPVSQTEPLELSLLGILCSDSPGALLQLLLGLEAHDASSPLAHKASVECSLAAGLQGLQLGVVLLAHASQGHYCCVLLVHKSSQASLQ
eukprot:7892-Heterococcus_DN1.PRE.1